MMFNKLYRVLVVLMLGALAACKPGAKFYESSIQTAPATQSDAVTTAQWNADEPDNRKDVLTGGSVYFDFDSYSVTADYQSLLQAYATYLKSHPQRHALIQGNTDERGTSEYNLALGQKRAEAVYRALEILGVPEVQMEAVSLGKEKPLAIGHDESSWKQNRRVDIVYQ
jgi:peptidoglycan-associated lipoprotein